MNGTPLCRQAKCKAAPSIVSICGRQVDFKGGLVPVIRNGINGHATNQTIRPGPFTKQRVFQESIGIRIGFGSDKPMLKMPVEMTILLSTQIAKTVLRKPTQLQRAANRAEMCPQCQP